MKLKSKKAVMALLLVAHITAGCVATPHSNSDGLKKYRGIELSGSNAPDFILFDQNGSEIGLSSFEEEVLAFAFTYTRCPSECLVIESNLFLIYNALSQNEQNNIGIVSITVDPEHDTISHLSNWTEKMNYNWPHLTGNYSDLQDLWTKWAIYTFEEDGGFVSNNEKNNDSSNITLITHNPALFIVDGERRMRILWRGQDWDPNDVLSDLRLLQSQT